MKVIKNQKYGYEKYMMKARTVFKNNRTIMSTKFIYLFIVQKIFIEQGGHVLKKYMEAKVGHDSKVIFNKMVIIQYNRFNKIIKNNNNNKSNVMRNEQKFALCHKCLYRILDGRDLYVLVKFALNALSLILDAL